MKFFDLIFILTLKKIGILKKEFFIKKGIPKYKYQYENLIDIIKKIVNSNKRELELYQELENYIKKDNIDNKSKKVLLNKIKPKIYLTRNIISEKEKERKKLEFKLKVIKKLLQE